MPDTYIPVDFRVYLRNHPYTLPHQHSDHGFYFQLILGDWTAPLRGSQFARVQQCLICLSECIVIEHLPTFWICYFGWILRSRVTKLEVSIIPKSCFPKSLSDSSSHQRILALCILTVSCIFLFSEVESIVCENIKKNNVKSRHKVYYKLTETEQGWLVAHIRLSSGPKARCEWGLDIATAHPCGPPQWEDLTEQECPLIHRTFWFYLFSFPSVLTSSLDQFLQRDLSASAPESHETPCFLCLDQYKGQK